MSWDVKAVPRAMSLEEQRTSMLNKYRFVKCCTSYNLIMFSCESIE